MHILSNCWKITVYPRDEDAKFAVTTNAFAHEYISYSSGSWEETVQMEVPSY